MLIMVPTSISSCNMWWGQGIHKCPVVTVTPTLCPSLLVCSLDTDISGLNIPLWVTNSMPIVEGMNIRLGQAFLTTSPLLKNLEKSRQIIWSCKCFMQLWIVHTYWLSWFMFLRTQTITVSVTGYPPSESGSFKGQWTTRPRFVPLLRLGKRALPEEVATQGSLGVLLLCAFRPRNKYVTPQGCQSSALFKH